MCKATDLKKMIVTVIAALAIMLAFTPVDAQAAAKGSITSAVNVPSGVKIVWKKDTSKTGYKIYRKAGTGKYKLVKTVKSKKTTTWTDKNTKNGTRYVYKVCSYKGKKITKCKVTKTCYRVNKASLYSVTSPAPGTLKIVTSKKDKATGFEIYYSTSSSFPAASTVKSVVKGTKVTKTIANLREGKVYYAKARAYRTVSGKKYYGDFSTVKSTVIKRTPISMTEMQSAVVAEAKRIWSTEESTYDSSHEINDIIGGVYTFDCSGFASHVICKVMKQYIPNYIITWDVKRMWYELPGQAIYNEGYSSEFRAQKVHEGTYDPKKLQPGDLVFFQERGEEKVNHVGIYIGDGEFIHSKQNSKITKSTLEEGHYYDYYVGAVRVIPEKTEPLELQMTTTGNVKLFGSEAEARKCKPDTEIGVLEKGADVILHYVSKYSAGGKDYYVGYITYQGAGYFIYSPATKLEQKEN